MAYFRWKGTINNVKRKGEVTAGSKEDAIIKLKKQNINVLSIKQSAPPIELDFLNNAKPKDIMIMTKQLSIMLNAGIPIVSAFNILIEQIKNPKLKKIIRNIKENIEAGSSFSNALREHKDIFSDLYINMVESGEASGNLDVVLQRLVITMEKDLELKRKLKGALIYPTMVSIVAVGVIALILTFVIPTFSKMYADSGMQLPLLTRMVIGASNFLRDYIIIILLIIAIIIGAFVIAKKKSIKFRTYIDSVLLKLPLLGTLILKTSIARFSSILSMLTSGGVSILEAIDIGAKTSGNLIIENALNKVKESVKEGSNLSEPISKAGIFPDMVSQMISVGEETGKLEDMLVKVSQYYEEEVDNSVKNLTTMLEPIIIVFLGVIVGTLVIAMYLPIFKMGQAIKGG
ncbi:Type 4 fimbrial assembly protein PilC [Desulfurella amilsii]|uniref:Type 4 fimbrial assembly protein PilC n=1 Tax=Desulfurella amilsii TaxID=1562698 RepID=A0A1X4XWI8_9BACT|nr:type II secretion system F family protein [Desulfurella amilsii]OSS41902.1 Type 4 fimbrial assembly protein PilC [Desulfurella amilsii]